MDSRLIRDNEFELFCDWFLGLRFRFELEAKVPISTLGAGKLPCLHCSSILVIIFATVLGAMVTGWCATMGPETGLRQVSISRYSLGWWPSKIIALLNVVEQLGWSSVGCITGGLALNAVSNGNVSLIVGVVIIAVAGLVFSFIGLRGVFVYEQFAWMVFLVIFLVIYGETARFADNLTPSSLSGATRSGTVLTLFAIM